VALTGSPRDAALHRELLSRQRGEIRGGICDLAGATRPLVLAALLERARGYVGVDTGPIVKGVPMLGSTMFRGKKPGQSMCTSYCQFKDACFGIEGGL